MIEGESHDCKERWGIKGIRGLGPSAPAAEEIDFASQRQLLHMTRCLELRADLRHDLHSNRLVEFPEIGHMPQIQDPTSHRALLEGLLI